MLLAPGIMLAWVCLVDLNRLCSRPIFRPLPLLCVWWFLCEWPGCDSILDSRHTHDSMTAIEDVTKHSTRYLTSLWSTPSFLVVNVLVPLYWCTSLSHIPSSPTYHIFLLKSTYRIFSSPNNLNLLNLFIRQKYSLIIVYLIFQSPIFFQHLENYTYLILSSPE